MSNIVKRPYHVLLCLTRIAFSIIYQHLKVVQFAP